MRTSGATITPGKRWVLSGWNMEHRREMIWPVGHNRMTSTQWLHNSRKTIEAHGIVQNPTNGTYWITFPEIGPENGG